MSETGFIKWLGAIRLEDVPRVGGKTASLGELYGELGAAGVRVPNGFAVTAAAYRALLDGDGLRDRLASILKDVTGEDVAALAIAGTHLRALVESAPLPPGLADEIVSAYRTLAREYGSEPAVAVRSSATAEDLPQASFAGQHESYLGVRGETALLAACRRCFASIFTASRTASIT
jgi:pyruvate,water dikinase